MEAGSLSALVEAVLLNAWRSDSAWHGEIHWRCVTATGLALASADPRVDRTLVFCFGLLHDARRVNEVVDREHGARAAEFAGVLRGDGALRLGDEAFAALDEALRLHSGGRVSTDPTIGTCWDADRLHLPRVSIVPDPALLSTRAARAPERLDDAEALRRDGPPAWDELVALV